jgi:putative tricarboxylic transport membrane protein
MTLDRSKLTSPGSIIAVLLVALSGSVLYATSSYPEPMVRGDPGPALFPRILACILILLAVLLFISSLKTKETTPRLSWRMMKRPLVVLLLLIAFVAAVDYWDTFILLPILLASVMMVMGERKLRMLIGVPLCFDAFVYLVFYRIFHIMLPTVYF